MVCCGGAVGRTFAQPFEDLLQFGGARDDDSRIDCAEIKQESEIIQIPIKKWILIVPFDLDSDAPLETINRVGGTVETSLVHKNGSRKFLFRPTARVERAVKSPRYWRSIAALFLDLGAEQSELAQDFDEVCPFLRTCRCQHAGSVAPFANVIERP
jgi:hypothetical protein